MVLKIIANTANLVHFYYFDGGFFASSFVFFSLFSFFLTLLFDLSPHFLATILVRLALILSHLDSSKASFAFLISNIKSLIELTHNF